MNSLSIITHQTPGIVTFDNYEETKAALQKRMRQYPTVVSIDDLDIAKDNLAELKQDRATISKAQKDLEKEYSKPYKEVEDKLNELLAIVDEVYKPLKSYVDDAEKKAKERDIRQFAYRAAGNLGDLGQKIVESPAFFKKDWLLKKYTVKKYQEEITEKINQAVIDIKVIQTLGSKDTPALMAHYISSLSMESVKDFKESLREEVSSDDMERSEEENKIRGYKILKITATEDQMASLLNQMELSGIEVEEIEDGMPKSMEELTVPDFTSFVAFDIETTGSFGAASGDDEAKITEIGAVRVVNGEVVEKFDELANPGRKIVPRISRITHITDEMVADKPPVDEVIRMFADFCQDSILVGHNIKSSDLHYIAKAARKAGVKMENPFLDTYILAKQFKKSEGWERMNLGYLSEYYGIEHEDKHRAWSDAAANAEVYFILKQLAESR